MVARLKTRSELGLGPVINRGWAMPSSDTLTVAPIGSMVKEYLRDSVLSVDVFARNSGLCKVTNDLNPQTNAEFHLDAFDFLILLKDRSITPDLVIFDPPYSSRQVKECYESIGLEMTQRDAQRACRWHAEKAVLAEIVVEFDADLDFSGVFKVATDEGGGFHFGYRFASTKPKGSVASPVYVNSLTYSDYQVMLDSAAAIIIGKITSEPRLKTMTNERTNRITKTIEAFFEPEVAAVAAD